MTNAIKGPPTEPGLWAMECESGLVITDSLIRFESGSMTDGVGYVRNTCNLLRGHMDDPIVKSWRLDAPAPPAWITDVGRLWEFIGKDIAVKEYQGHWTFGKLQGVEGAAYSIQNCTRYAGDVFRFCEIQLPEEPMEPQLPPVLEDIQVCSIGIPGDGIVPEDQLDAVRERARKCYNALAGVEDVEGFAAAARGRA